ncbi:hypothetical protein F4860DRAFT_165539 [Xylaria cubensis]|nr:hypothetical protein F4860DRAFT_165539 [Xylaria cubensis]
MSCPVILRRRFLPFPLSVFFWKGHSAKALGEFFPSFNHFDIWLLLFIAYYRLFLFPSVWAGGRNSIAYERIFKGQGSLSLLGLFVWMEWN